MMYYAEIQNFAGAWRPAKFAVRPKCRRVGVKDRIITSDGYGAPIRRIAEIDPLYLTYDLSALQGIYGGDNDEENHTTGAAEPRS